MGEEIISTPLDESLPAFEIEEDEPVSMNMFGFTPQIFEYLHKRFIDFMNGVKAGKNPLKAEFLIPDIVAEQIKKGMASVRVLDTSAVWHGVTYKEDKPEVVASIKALVDSGEYPSELWGKN